MAEKTGGGRVFWLILGVLIGVAATLAVQVFLSSGPGDGIEPRTAADEAAAAAARPDPAALPAPAVPRTQGDMPRPHDVGIDPVTDDQIADDAAAAGMTSRRPPAEGE